MRKKMIVKREKIVKVHKIQLIYYSKLKYNIIGRKISKKTRNLTQNRARNDPIHWRVKAFHSAF